MPEVMHRTDLAYRRHDTVSAHLDVIRAIEQAVADNLNLLAPLDKAWQPTDYLPDLESASWQDEVECFRETAEAVSDDLLVVLVGDMVTEEALPSYSMALNGLVRDEEGDGPAPWALWLRGWTAEENRHVYTVRDYASIIAHLVKAWDIAGRSVTGEAARAQVELYRQPERYERLAERTAAAMAKQPPRAFSWIRDRTV